MERNGGRVLVTGGGGFIGTHLVRHLVAMDCEVVSLGSHRDGKDLVTGVNYIFGDLSQRTLETVDLIPEHIFHLAGGASVTASIINAPADFLKTVFSTVQLLDFARRHWPTAKLVYVSSAAVYGEAKHRAPNHAAHCLPISPYGLHKKQVEGLLLDYGRLFGTRSVIVRPFSVYGPGLRKQLLWDAMQKTDRGEFAFFGSGDELRDWVYVEDLIEFLIRAKDHTTVLAPILNAGTGVAVSVRDVLTQLFQVAGLDHPPVFMGEKKEGDPNRLVADGPTSQLFEEVFKTPLIDGLRAYVDWYRKRGAA